MAHNRAPSIRSMQYIAVYIIKQNTMQRIGRDYGAGAQRDKASKMAQIQNYVGILIQNNKGYAQELELLRKENTDLRGQVELLMGDLLRTKQNYEGSLAQTKRTYAEEVGGLIQELKDILHKKEQMEGSYKSLLQELSYQSQADRLNRAAQLADLQRNYENKLRILNDRIQDQNRQLQANFYLSSDTKLKMVKEIDALRFEAGELRKQNADLIHNQTFFQEEMARLSSGLKTAAKEKEELGVSLLKMQQEKNQAIIQLRQGAAQLRDQLNDQLDNAKRMEVALNCKEKEYQVLAQRNLHQQRQRAEIQALHHRTSIQLAERQGELSAASIELNRLSESSSKEAKRMADLIKMLQSQNGKLMQERDQLQGLNLEKQQEIYTLLQRVQKLERQCEVNKNQLAKFQQENIALSRNNQLLKEQLEISLLQQRKYSEKCQLQLNHIETLQKLIQKQRKRAAYLQCAGSDREVAHCRQLSLENDINHRYEAELQAAFREKSEMANIFQAEKDRLVRNYENVLKEKELHFKDKIRFLQSEVLELSKLT